MTPKLSMTLAVVVVVSLAVFAADTWNDKVAVEKQLASWQDFSLVVQAMAEDSGTTDIRVIRWIRNGDTTFTTPFTITGTIGGVYFTLYREFEWKQGRGR